MYHLEPRVSVYMLVLVRKQYDHIFSQKKISISSMEQGLNESPIKKLK